MSVSDGLTCVSCPGKVFIAGGYLVLDPAYPAYVVATASRFYAVVRQSVTPDPGLRLRVQSPQFEQATWLYRCVTNERATDCTVEQTGSGPRNPFIQIALEETCRLLLALLGALSDAAWLDIWVLGDNDFYSQERSTKNHERRPFQQLGCTIADVHKTGLGSSAAMVTSLVGALLAHFKVDIIERRALVHNLAQYVHSLAQGKIGSGFDVSAAVYGTQCYRRFDPKLLPDLSSTRDMTARNLLAALDPVPNSAWRDETKGGSVRDFALPPMTALVLADVDAGSNTPSMVSRVLKWRTANPAAANRLWSQLSHNNQQLASRFEALQIRFQQYPKEYADAVRALMDNHEDSASASESLSAFRAVRATIEAIRGGMRAMGLAADVPIEPPQQTALIDSISQQRGVLGGGVPGAGGFDAIWLLVLAPDQTIVDGVESALAMYPHSNVSPLSKAARMYGRRDRGEEPRSTNGIQLEDVSEVEGLMEILRTSSTYL